MKLPILLLCLGLLAWPTLAAAQDPLDPARELYAAADYEGALTALERLDVENDPARSVEVGTYRVLCLVALGRAEEADGVIEDILTTDPLYEPSSTDAPPRVRAAFSRARKRVLPQIARESYAAGKAAFDEKAFHRAATRLEETIRLIDGAEAKGEADLEELDLRTLARGFLDLSLASMAPATPATPTTPLPEAAPLANPTAAAVRTPPNATKTAPSTSNTVANSSNPAAGAAKPAAGAGAKRPDSDPVSLQQVLPPWPAASLGPLGQMEFRGTIEVDIDETGKVVASTITKSIHPMYDAALLKASRAWTYEPAYRDGKPVRLKKVVEVVLRPR